MKKDAAASSQANHTLGMGDEIGTQASTVLKTVQVILMHSKVGEPLKNP